MKTLNQQLIRLSATDLSNHAACRHLTTLDLQEARGARVAPQWATPDLAIIQERGKRHESAFLAHLADQKKLAVVNLAHIKDENKLLQETQRYMAEGAQAIAQGALANADWFGRPDVLLRVPQHSAKWKWSYEVLDTKLARETKAATILQLSLYSQLLEHAQGCAPETMWVIPPGNNFGGEEYRVSEYAAYFRYVQDRLARVVLSGNDHSTYPEPVEHCNVCRWFRECDAQRRADDHLSLVAGIRRQQRAQLEQWNTDTMAKLAILPIPLQQKPDHGSRDGIERAREQARLQVEGRTTNTLVHEPLLPPVEGIGLCRLPEPSPDDLFLDLEGDPFVDESGLQYLFGLAFRNLLGELVYEKRWALNREQEKQAFEWLVDEIMLRRKANPRMHVYHFGAYEPGTLKRLMGMYATREDQIDRILRAGALVDLHQSFKQSTRASIEEYSLKKIEAFYNFKRQIAPDVSRAAMRYIEHKLELGWENEQLPDDMRAAMEGYNREDCFSTAHLRDWLENERATLINNGTEVPRFTDRDEKPSDDLDERQKRVAALVEELTAGIPPDAKARTKEQQAKWLLAQLLDWHRRESKPKAWRYFELRGMDDEALLDEKDAISGLIWMERRTSSDGSLVDRYSFPNQETSIRGDDKKEVHYRDQRIGTIADLDPINRTVDIKQAGDSVGFHPSAIFVKEPYRKTTAQQDSLYRLGCWVRDNGIDAPGEWSAARGLLLHKPPGLTNSEKLELNGTEDFADELARIVAALNFSVLPVQGPPGSGKTTNAARAIEKLVKEQKMRIGVVALSHNVIRLLLRKIFTESLGLLRCMHKSDGKEKGRDHGIVITTKNEVPLRHLRQRTMDVVGGTSWLWARQEYAASIDVLFVDEASQLSLAEVLAVSQAAKSVVLIGDPQQLARPGEACHPIGAERSGLEHILNDPKLGKLRTMPASLGLFIEETKRLHPNICSFTSEVFYEGRLHARAFTRSRVLSGHPWCSGAGLWFVPVRHQGNRNSAPEEVEVVAQIVGQLLRPGVEWFRGAGTKNPLKKEEILIVTPYNAQLSDLGARLPDISMGTVDKFQGQEAPVVIYSLTTSSPEDAPRGMEFLFSLNRLNVATSRAMTTVIVVGSPKLFEPDCRTPRQMQLANALCRFRELATPVTRLTSLP